jgi:hypothetical protein
MEIVREPAVQGSDVAQLGVAFGGFTGDGAELWPILMFAVEPMLVRMLDENDQPLPGYSPTFRAVDANGNSLEDRVMFDVTAGGGSGSGSKHGTPALESGVSTLYMLLLDAHNGTCFQIEAYFKAFDAWEAGALAAEGLGSYDDTRVSIISQRRFCAVNGRSLSIVQSPSSAVQLGSRLPQVPEIRITTPLIPVYLSDPDPAIPAAMGVPFTANERAADILWYVPKGLAMLQSIRMLPYSMAGVTFPEARRERVATRTLDGHMCLMYGGGAVAGGCRSAPQDPNVVSARVFDEDDPDLGYLTHGVVLGGTNYDASIYRRHGLNHSSNPNLFEAARPGDPPTFVERYTFNDLRWAQTQPSLGNTMQLMAVTDAVLSGGSAAVSDTMVVETTPASVSLTSVPPLSVSVNEPFLLTGIVRISSGAPLRSTLVTVSTAPVSGAKVSALSFLQGLIGQQTVEASSAPPTLLKRSASGFTDENGIVRFILKFKAGPLSTQTSLILRAGDIESSRSRAITVFNDIESITSTNLTYHRTGSVNAIGSPYDPRVLRDGEAKDTFPIVARVNDPIRITAVLSEHTLESVLANVSWLRREVSFRIFDQFHHILFLLTENVNIHCQQ